MLETWNAFLDGLAARDPLVYAALAVVAALFAYGLVRALMRVRWLALLMRIGYFGGVVGLVALGALSLSYYQWQAWLPLGGSMLRELAGSPVVWVVAAVVVAAGLALRRPVPPRHGIRLSAVSAPSVPPAQAGNVVQGPWRREAGERDAA